MDLGGEPSTLVNVTQVHQSRCAVQRSVYGRHLILSARAEGKPARIMIDTGATGNYISTRFVGRQRLTAKLKPRPYHLSLADGTPIQENDGRVKHEVQLDQLVIGRHRETITMDMIDIPQDAILGIPWLQQHSPVVNWKTREMTFPRCECTRETQTPRVPKAE